MTAEQKQIVLDKCATEEIRKDAELLFDVLDQAGIEYDPGELDLSAKVDEFDFEKYLPKEYAETLKAGLKQCLKDVLLKYDIWIPIKGWAFNVEALDKNNAYPRWHDGGVDAWVVDSVIYEIDRFDPEDPYSELLFAMLQIAGYNDWTGFKECLNSFFKEAYSSHSYPYEIVDRNRSYEPKERRSYRGWFKGALANIPIRYLEYGTEAVLAFDYPQWFYKALLGNKYSEISEERQQQYFAANPEWEQRFFDTYKAILGGQANEGKNLSKVNPKKAHEKALEAIREINPDFAREGLYNN